MGIMKIESALLKKISDAFYHGVEVMKDYGDETLIHDNAAKDGFLVVDGRCNNPDCCICTQAVLAAEIEAMVEQDEAPLQIDTREAQASLLLTINPVLAERQRTKYYIGEPVT